MKHPNEAELALYAGGELPFWKRWLAGLHIRTCEACRLDVAAYRRDAEFIEDTAGKLPEDVNWQYLAADMKANIQVGIRAAECVTPAAPANPRIGWRAAAVLASITVLMVGGWWLHFPRLGQSGPSTEGAVLAATEEGIELLEEKDRALTLMHESSEPVLLSVNVDGAMSARYVDDETGMVTINNVYVQ